MAGLEISESITAYERGWDVVFGVSVLFQPPALGEEAIRQAGKGGAIWDEVIFHSVRMLMAFADYVQAMRSYSGF